jgi:methionyl-tRNA formyltransferase
LLDAADNVAPMRLLFAGTPAAALPSIEALLRSRHEVIAVLTRPDARSGRGRRLRPSPVAERALSGGLEVLRPRQLTDEQFLARLAELAPDCAPVVAYGALLPTPVLDVPRFGWVNLHFSLLPAWRGAAPVHAAIRAGDQLTGATTFEIVEELDAGPILGVLTEPIRPRDTSGELLDRLAHAGAELLVQTLDGIEAGLLAGRPQPAEGISYARKVHDDDARVDWTAPAMHVDRVVRSVSPEPGAWTIFRGSRLGLGPVLPRPELSAASPGVITTTRSQVLVGTATHQVELSSVQPAGRPTMAAADWARGARLDVEMFQ